jgi:hypothetical protein
VPAPRGIKNPKEIDMARVTRDELLFKKPVKEMSEEERALAIERLEILRDEIIYEIEDVMKEASAETGVKKFARRKHKLGKAPNDN